MHGVSEPGRTSCANGGPRRLPAAATKHTCASRGYGHSQSLLRSVQTAGWLPQRPVVQEGQRCGGHLVLAWPSRRICSSRQLRDDEFCSRGCRDTFGAELGDGQLLTQNRAPRSPSPGVGHETICHNLSISVDFVTCRAVPCPGFGDRRILLADPSWPRLGGPLGPQAPGAPRRKGPYFLT